MNPKRGQEVNFTLSSPKITTSLQFTPTPTPPHPPNFELLDTAKLKKRKLFNGVKKHRRLQMGLCFFSLSILFAKLIVFLDFAICENSEWRGGLFLGYPQDEWRNGLNSVEIGKSKNTEQFWCVARTRRSNGDSWLHVRQHPLRMLGFGNFKVWCNAYGFKSVSATVHSRSRYHSIIIALRNMLYLSIAVRILTQYTANNVRYIYKVAIKPLSKFERRRGTARHGEAFSPGTAFSPFRYNKIR